jgi:hypothetical protein
MGGGINCRPLVLRKAASASYRIHHTDYQRKQNAIFNLWSIGSCMILIFRLFGL